MPGRTPLSEGRMDPWEDEGETGEETGFEIDETLDDGPAVPEGLGALGQLAVAVLVVALLVAMLIGTSAALRRMLG